MKLIKAPPAIHAAMPGLLGVHSYEDVFEKFTRWDLLARGLRGRLRGKIDQAVLDHQLLFIHVPKNAGTSIAAAVYGYSPAHRSAYYFHSVAKDFIDRAQSFAVLRDPVDRFLSTYWFIRNGGGDDVAMNPSFRAAVAGIETLDALLDFTEANIKDVYKLYNVLRPQWWYVTDDQGRILVDRLFILGEHQDEMSAFLSQFGVAEIPTKNRTKKGALDLTEAQAERIRRLYARDVELIERVRAGGTGPLL